MDTEYGEVTTSCTIFNITDSDDDSLHRLIDIAKTEPRDYMGWNLNDDDKEEVIQASDDLMDIYPSYASINLYKTGQNEGMQAHRDTYACFATEIIELTSNEHALTLPNAATYEAITPADIIFIDPSQNHGVPMAVRNSDRIAITITM